MQKLSTTTFHPEVLARMVSTGALAMPDFQRDFIWTPAKVVDFLESIAAGWPSGALLFLEAIDGPQRFAAKGFDQGPNVAGRTPRFYVLDGQQRITALYHAFFDKSEHVYCVDFSAILRGDPDYIFAIHTSRYKGRQHEYLASVGEDLLFRVSEIVDEKTFRTRLSKLPTDRARQVAAARKRDLVGFLPENYQMPVTLLPESLELAALAKIFETTNRQGVRLNAFDLMVAVLYPRGFYLKDRWEEALVAHPEFGALEVDGLQILRLIAIRERSKPSRSGPPTVRGVRQSDVLKVEASRVTKEWESAVSSFVKSIAYAHQHLGVISEAVVPSDSMLLTLVALRESGLSDKESDRWFWRSCISQSHAQGANTQVVIDIDRRGNPSERSIDLLELLAQPVARNGIAVRGLACALIVGGAIDLTTGRPFRDERKAVELELRSYRSLFGPLPKDYPQAIAETMVIRKGSLMRHRAIIQGGGPEALTWWKSQRLGKAPSDSQHVQSKELDVGALSKTRASLLKELAEVGNV